jgi:hypothetical protein
LIEKIARAICSAVGDDPDDIWSDLSGNDPDLEGWRIYIGPAMAAVEALGGGNGES